MKSEIELNGDSGWVCWSWVNEDPRVLSNLLRGAALATDTLSYGLFCEFALLHSMSLQWQVVK